MPGDVQPAERGKGRIDAKGHGARQSNETKRSIGIYTCIYVCTRYAYGRDRCGPRRYENERYIGT